jgi:transcriptional regulator with XRE-family HTH domain
MEGLKPNNFCDSNPGGYRTVGEHSASERMRLGLSQTTVASKLLRPQSMVSRWEAGERAMTPHEFVELAGLLALDPDELLQTARLLRDSRQRSSRARPRNERLAVGVAIAAARKRASLDPVATARQAELTTYRLWRIEGGYDATLFELAAIANALGVTPSSLVPKPYLTVRQISQISVGADQLRTGRTGQGAEITFEPNISSRHAYALG